MKLYSVCDTKVGVFDKPFTMRNRNEALRGWMEVVNDKQTQFNKHPEDFCLFELGDYDQDKGIISPYPGPQSVASAIDVIKLDPKPLSVAQ